MVFLSCCSQLLIWETSHFLSDCDILLYLNQSTIEESFLLAITLFFVTMLIFLTIHHPNFIINHFDNPFTLHLCNIHFFISLDLYDFIPTLLSIITLNLCSKCLCKNLDRLVHRHLKSAKQLNFSKESIHLFQA